MKFVNFSEQKIEPVEKPFDQKNIVEGAPEQHVWNHFTGANERFKSGMWDCSAGVCVGPMNEQIEYCHILEGEARIETPDCKKPYSSCWRLLCDEQRTTTRMVC